MIKKRIKYVDYNGVERTEDFWFDLSEAEILERQNSEYLGYDEMLKRMLLSNDGPTIMRTFKEFLLSSYGVKTPDGRQFMKSEEISKSFEQSPAYSIMLMDICYNPEHAIAFINGVVPKNLSEKAKAAKESRNNMLNHDEEVLDMASIEASLAEKEPSDESKEETKPAVVEEFPKTDDQ